ncbi:hypothetical protein TorRG33x02_000860 [Trema orientale]|uniref:Uncharacterized protein n=1 Tax=Trema orientale TaxID=63057 RepID=A0A2P5G181_TREOI|nr:hypothetical protein TorRG33x02_000860 [Trema orientale]
MDEQPTQAQGQGEAQPPLPPPPPPPSVPESQSQGGEDEEEEEEEEEEAKNEDDELITKAQKLMEKITSSPDNPNPTVLHALASLFETQESSWVGGGAGGVGCVEMFEVSNAGSLEGINVAYFYFKNVTKI